jgi:hypothetical protein
MSLILDGSNGLSDVDGTAATPAIRGTDTNTGIFFPAADTIAFSEGGTESARFDSAGNVGIGTTTPAVKLHVNKGSVGETVRFTGSTDNARSLTFNSSNEGGFDGATWQRNILSSGGNHTWAVNNTERMRITSAGNLLVGRTSFDETVVGSYLGADGLIQATRNGGAVFSVRRLTSNGSVMDIRRDGTIVGSISVTTTATTYNTSSDYRLKENIAPMTDALNRVAQLKPVTYKWKIDGSDGEGFIAHELQAVVPECVTGEKDAVDADGNPEYQGIDTSFLVATLTAAIQELKATVDAQAARIAALENPPVESATNE